MARIPNTRAFDIIIFGATGFTGVEITKYLAKSCEGIKWAIAGRSHPKMENLIQTIKSKELPEPHDVIIADINNEESLRACTEQTKLILNCTGPYRYLGEAVVRACIETQTDYIDLCGEPEFMERMVAKFHEQAQQKGILILHACAFDSIPADLGVIFTANQFKDMSCESVESFLTIDSGREGGGIHYTTYEALVLGFGSVDKLRALRRQTRNMYRPIVRVPNSHLRRHTKPYYDNRVNRWCIPFPGSDASVVRMTQSAISTREDSSITQPHYSAYFTIPSFFGLCIIVFMGTLLQLFAKCKCGRRILLNYPKFFTCGLVTHEGPTEEQMKEASFNMKFFAKGRLSEEQSKSVLNDNLESKLLENEEKTIITQVSGPEPGYIATSAIFVNVAKCLLEERSSLPVNGGVFTPGAVFSHSSLIQRLNMSGIKFQVLNK